MENSIAAQIELTRRHFEDAGADNNPVIISFPPKQVRSRSPSPSARRKRVEDGNGDSGDVQTISDDVVEDGNNESLENQSGVPLTEGNFSQASGFEEKS